MLRLLLSLLFLGCHAVVAEPGLPIRGWSSWTQFRCHVNETLVLQMGRAIVDSGLAASGYNYVLLDDEDFDSVKIESRKTLELVQFVDACEIDPLYFEKPYYVVPSDNLAEEAFIVLR